AFWDDAEHRWVAEAGEFQALVGRSAGEIVLSARFELADTVRFDGPGSQASSLSLQSTIKDLLADDSARALLDEYIPGFSGNPQLGFASGLSLEQVAGFDAQTFSEQTLRAIKSGLDDLNSRSQQ
ncbi:MAG: beta-glucosidase, partial [Chloroflexota bacterium]